MALACGRTARDLATDGPAPHREEPGLRRFRAGSDQDGVSSIAAAWETTPHSYARKFYLPALIRLRPPDLQAYLDDATDDCESDVRDIASAHLEQPA